MKRLKISYTHQFMNKILNNRISLSLQEILVSILIEINKYQEVSIFGEGIKVCQPGKSIQQTKQIKMMKY